jgi:hypothetical protein
MSQLKIEYCELGIPTVKETWAENATDNWHGDTPVDWPECMGVARLTHFKKRRVGQIWDHILGYANEYERAPSAERYFEWAYARRVEENLRRAEENLKTLVVFQGPLRYYPRKETALQREFRELSTLWRQETMMVSSTSETTTNFHYYRIIALGPDVVPLILRDLQENGGQWYLALRALTGENPVDAEDRGNIRKMKAAWIDWGKSRGFCD